MKRRPPIDRGPLKSLPTSEDPQLEKVQTIAAWFRLNGMHMAYQITPRLVEDDQINMEYLLTFKKPSDCQHVIGKLFESDISYLSNPISIIISNQAVIKMGRKLQIALERSRAQEELPPRSAQRIGWSDDDSRVSGEAPQPRARSSSVSSRSILRNPIAQIESASAEPSRAGRAASAVLSARTPVIGAARSSSAAPARARLSADNLSSRIEGRPSASSPTPRIPDDPSRASLSSEPAQRAGAAPRAERTPSVSRRAPLIPNPPSEDAKHRLFLRKGTGITAARSASVVRLRAPAPEVSSSSALQPSVAITPAPEALPVALQDRRGDLTRDGHGPSAALGSGDISPPPELPRNTAPQPAPSPLRESLTVPLPPPPPTGVAAARLAQRIEEAQRAVPIIDSYGDQLKKVEKRMIEGGEQFAYIFKDQDACDKYAQHLAREYQIKASTSQQEPNTLCFSAEQVEEMRLKLNIPGAAHAR